MRILILPLLLAAFIVNAQNKQAIIIAIDEYPSESGWSSISSDKDVELLMPVYEAQGFQNPVVVRDKAASKEGILSAMRNFRDRCKPGDIVLVHYSGHGQQIADNNGDEPDGLDEALVAWGAPAEYYTGYNGEKHLRDDEFNELLLDIRGKIGSKGNMLVVVDACHSGTISRGVGKKRGGKAPLVPPGYQINAAKREDGSGYAAKTRGQAQTIAPMVLISASSFDEENSETFDERGVGIGSLSYAMAKSLSKVGENYSYRSLFADVLGVMNEKVPQQTPMVEGDVDYALFAGQYFKQEQYYDVREVKGKDIILNGGSLMGIYPDTKVAFYPAGTINPNQSNALGYGVVSKVSPLQSVIKPEAASASIDLSKSWVFITEPSFGNVSLSCNIVKIKNPGIKKDMEALLAA
ncbi:MAG: caspase family protein, partial [Bacteroidota bacterium]